ncbi:retrovirus-related pol polyprotein from transposon TNT 1-94 [Tanacetum coccineum]
MRVQIINGKKYILVIVDDYSRYILTDKGTEFVNQVLTTYYESVSIFYQKSVPRTPQQNDVVERRNRTLVEAARTMLIFSKALMFLWAEAVATALFGALYYLTNDSEDLGKLQPTADIGFFVGLVPTFLTPGQIKPPRVERPVSPAPVVPVLVTSAGTPSSTTIDQDTSSPSHSPSSSALQSPSLHQGVAAGSTLIEGNPFAHADNDPLTPPNFTQRNIQH